VILAGEVEVCKILATIGVALVSVSITTYAIAISVLGSGRARLQAQIDDIYARADAKFRRGEIKGLEAAEKEVASARAESKKVLTLLSRLSLVNVVLFPGLFFTLSIVFAVQGILQYSANPATANELMYYQNSAISLAAGLVFLLFALVSIERAAGQPRPSNVAVPASETGVVAYYFVDSPGEKLVVDWNRRIAYWFDARIDQAAREGKIKLVAIPGKRGQAFASDNQLTYVPHAPSEQELPL
jgi:hypothetical protein